MELLFQRFSYLRACRCIGKSMVSCSIFIILCSVIPIFGQASIGGVVWMDENKNGIREAAERGFSGVLVELYHKVAEDQFSLVGAQRTASNGHYLYIISADLLPGEFYLQFESAPGLRFSPVNQGDDDARDSDVDPITGRTPIIEIENGYNSNQWGAGYYPHQEIVPTDTTTPPPPPPPPQQKQADLSLLLFADKTTVHVGDTLYYTIQITNLGPDTAVQVQVVFPWSAALHLLHSDPPPQDILTDPLVWFLEEMAPQTSLQITFSAQVINAGVLDEPGCAASQTSDNNLSNNCQYYQIDIETPVELTAFTATRRFDGVHIQWITQSEKENMGFYLYRSQTEEGGYERLNEKMIPGQGTTAIKHTYEYIDETIVENTIYFYKLQDIDYAGRMVMHGPISVSTFAPEQYTLLQNYPNPFNSNTRIEFELPEAGRVELAIYNTSGQLIRMLLFEERAAGRHLVQWDGLDSMGRQVSSGVYVYVLKVNGQQQVRKMQILK